MAIRILRKPEVIERVGKPGVTTLYRWIRDGHFPAPRQVGPNTVGWLEDEVDAWLRSRPTK
jgi:prophage regulatory protein